ncbi:MAG: transglycosylase SLT domain-containing protein [Kangiellaceae bacterium]|nr:transglycosylase SLT domain-containing protein [Kangiellaceae bacterium]
MRILASSLLLTIVTSFSTVQAKPAPKNLNPNQKTFLAAEKAFADGDAATYQQLKESLSHYPLYPYLLYGELSKNLNPQNRISIDNFVKLYANSPLSDRLISSYINSLANKGHYDLMSEYFAEQFTESNNAKLKCLYIQHQLNNGAPLKQYVNDIGKLWNVPKSQAKECDGVFARWSNAGHLDHKIAYERYYQTAHEGAVGLLKYLSRFLHKDEQYITELWQKVKADPGVVAQRNFFPQKNPNLEAPVLVYAIKKLAWGDRDAAHRVWQKTQRAIPLAQGHKNEVERTMFLAQATENKKRALTWAKRHLNDMLEDELVNHWKLATFLRHNQWKRIQELYHILPNEQKETLQWRYWFAIALEKSGQAVEAMPLLQQIAKERDYYGYKAATRLKLPLQLNHQDAPISDEVFQQVSKSANIERARELYALERYINASREWREQLNRMDSPEQIMAAAKIANQWGWYNQAIITIAKAKHWDDTNIRFPTAFEEDYVAMAKKVDLPPQWLMGVTRQESAYGPFAVSGAGAYGLMQVLPSTAKIYSKKLGIGYQGRNDLFNPDTNIEMGSHYLKLRYQELDNNPIYASAAYNAGKHRIDKWKPFGRHPTDIWIEAIPYTETRDYIKKVMTYRMIYALKLGKKDDIFEYILNTQTGG